MKHRSHTVEGYPDPRPLPFANLTACGDEQRFNIPPRDAGAHRVTENCLQGSVVFSSQGHLVSLFSIICNILDTGCLYIVC